MRSFLKGDKQALRRRPTLIEPSAIILIRDDIAVNMDGVDAARQANDNTRADVTQMREQMSVMWKQIKAPQAQVRGITGEP